MQHELHEPLSFTAKQNFGSGEGHSPSGGRSGGGPISIVPRHIGLKGAALTLPILSGLQRWHWGPPVDHTGRPKQLPILRLHSLPALPRSAAGHENHTSYGTVQEPRACQPVLLLPSVSDATGKYP
jgi:hypothetical protein